MSAIRALRPARCLEVMTAKFEPREPFTADLDVAAILLSQDHGVSLGRHTGA